MQLSLKQASDILKQLEEENQLTCGCNCPMYRDICYDLGSPYKSAMTHPDVVEPILIEYAKQKGIKIDE